MSMWVSDDVTGPADSRPRSVSATREARPVPVGGAQPGSGAGTQQAGRLPDPGATPDGECGAARLAPEGLLRGPPERWPLRPAGWALAVRLTGQEGSAPGFHTDDSSAAELRCPAGQGPSPPPALGLFHTWKEEN